MICGLGHRSYRSLGGIGRITMMRTTSSSVNGPIKRVVEVEVGKDLFDSLDC